MSGARYGPNCCTGWIVGTDFSSVDYRSPSGAQVTVPRDRLWSARAPSGRVVSSRRMNSDLGRRIIEAGNITDPARRAAAQREVFAPHYVLHPRNDPDVVGLDAYIQRTSPSQQFFDSMEFFLDDLIETADGFVMRYHWTAAYKGQPIGNRAIEINRVADGLVVETWNAQDHWSVIQQISAIDASAPELD